MLLRLISDQFIDLHAFSYLDGTKSFEILKSLIRSSDHRLCAVHDSRMEANNVVSQKVKMLQRADHMVFEERGTNDLHVGWPFIRGKFSDGTPVRCPLIYFPVKLVQKNQHWVLESRDDAGITFNKVFLLAYAFYHKLQVEEDLLDFSFDDFDEDITVFRTELYELLKTKIELNFNTENFQDELKPFVQYKRSEFDEQHRSGELKLYPEAVIGIFPQAGSQLVPDYLHLLEDDRFSDLEEFFVKDFSKSADGEQSQSTSPVIKEEKLFTPFALDAYQENAIHQVKKGKSLVVQGPPGTGKSQLICNLLADAMAAGKRVLLVCQKKAALDVVYQRMEARGLAQFLGLVHDFRNDRRQVFDKIAHQIASIEEYKTRNRSVDIIQMERKFFQVCRSIDHITEELQEFKNALFDDQECGIAIKQLYLLSNPEKPSLNLKQEYHYFRFPLTGFIRRIRQYARYAALFERDDYPWKGRKPFVNLQASDQRKIEETIDAITEYQKCISSEVFRLTGARLNLEDSETLWYRHEEILGMLSLIKSDNTYRYFQLMCRETDDETSLLWLSNMERVVMNCFDEIGPEVTIPAEMLGKYQEALHERMTARGNLIRRIKWEFFSDNRFLIKRALVANELSYNKWGLRVLEQRIDTRLNLEHHLTSLREKVWLTDIPSDYRKDNLQHWFSMQKLSVRAKLIFKSLREIKDSVNPETLSRPQFHALMRNLLDVLKNIPAQKEEWLRVLSKYHLRQVILDPAAADLLKQSLRSDFDNLCEFDSLKESMSGMEENVVFKLHDQTGNWDQMEFESLFTNSIGLAWIDHIEMKFPILRSVSSLRMEELQGELQRLVSEKQELSLEILLLRARENAYENLTYNRLNNLVTYRDLRHQVTKKKKLWPLRKLISKYNEELFQLVPCWMASPESVSAIFPMETLFDLVIFDEASQCFSERGLPAMYRGRQVLIAGDGQQLRPNDLYQVRWTDESSDDADLEVESLLELAERYLPTVHLQGHYRSKAMELIAFSNRNFYGNRLQLLPERNSLNRHEPALEYHKVDGVWANQTNEAEACEVVRRVLDYIENFPDKEIGVVTFNAPQQNLILDILEESLADSNTPFPDSLFVKNIENVQGDERDVIIFSVGYAPDKSGKLALQFGSLNQSGGENRLNVAVTRAREKIIIVTSIYPEQLRADQTKNKGPKLLQEYLEFAFQVHQRQFTPGVGVSTGKNGMLELGSHLANWSGTRLKDFTFELNSLPYTDVNVKSGDSYLGVLLTDDERFRQSISIKDAFAYTPSLLEAKNWNYRYVYSRQYWKDLESLEKSLMVFVGNQAN